MRKGRVERNTEHAECDQCAPQTILYNKRIIVLESLHFYRMFRMGGKHMAKENKVNASRPALKYRQLAISDLDRGRRGKHHELVQGILQELKVAAPGSALEIPIADVGGIGLANLRSAVHRASTAEGLAIETLADDKNFYVWKK
jgi:hypothetical protein